MPLFSFVLVEEGQPDWDRQFDCADDASAIVEGHAMLANQLMLRPDARLQLVIARPDGAVVGRCGPGGAFRPGPPDPEAPE